MKFEEMTKEELISYINSMSEDRTGKFGLVWDREKEPEQIVVDCDKMIPVFDKIDGLDIDKKSDIENLIIQGDNYHILSSLCYTHAEKIDVIYIDPPYNKGKDFTYNDKKVDAEDGYKHSKWLNFMEKRLQLAKRLLSEDGVLFISIDDSEASQLKLLCDKVLGDFNFISQMPRVTKKAGKSTSSFSKNHDYILIYTKMDSNVFVMDEYIDDEFKYVDEYEEQRGSYKLNQTLDYNTLGYVYSLDFPITIGEKTYYPGSVTKEEYEKRKQENPKDGYRWRWSEKLVKFGMENGWMVVNEKTGRIYTKTYSKASIKKKDGDNYYIEYTQRTKPMSSLELIDNMYSNDNAKKELDAFNLAHNFDYPKPASLIKRLLKSYYKKDAKVLDFFAGSGTTAQAVLELNKEDKGTRQFIIATNNENNIFDNITYPRVSKVINGYIDKKGNEVSGITSNLRCFKTTFVENTNNRDQLHYDLTEKCIPMLCVKENTYYIYKETDEYKIYTNQTNDKYTCIYFDIFGNKEDEFINDLKLISESKVIYKFSLGDYIDETIFKSIDNYTIEAIPYKIIEVYRKLVKLSKEEI